MVSLQTRIVELEGRVRRAAAERGAVEMKKNEFQGELEKQREQLDKIQSSHNFQMESVNKLYQDEKARPAWLPLNSVLNAVYTLLNSPQWEDKQLRVYVCCCLVT